MHFSPFVAFIDWKLALGGLVAVAVLAAAIAIWGYRRRHQHLSEKYGSAEIAQRIVHGTIWQGETAEQLVESLGRPEDIDQKVLKTKTKEVWKYRPTGKNRYGLKITLDDGVVTGWERQD